jgi:aminoglycoside phosphotransferase (APT) family kinase protein
VTLCENLTVIGAPFSVVELVAVRVLRTETDLDAERAAGALVDLGRLHALLAQRCPAESDVAIVHGDPRIDNAILDAVPPLAAAGLERLRG